MKEKGHVRMMQFLKGYGRQSVLAPAFKLLEALFDLFVPLVVAQMINRGIAQGDKIEITSHRGSIQVKANLTLKAEPGVVCFYHGYGEADANELTDNEILDPYSGFPSYRETRVSIRRV